MKKLLYLLLLLPLGFLGSCSDDDDFPSADITMTIDNAVESSGKVYIVAGEPLTVEGMTVKGLGGNAAAISGVNYFLDHVGIAYSNVSPFGIEIPSVYLPVGTHLFSSIFDVLQVDKTLASARVGVYVVVVETAADLPDGATPGPVEINFKLNAK